MKKALFRFFPERAFFLPVINPTAFLKAALAISAEMSYNKNVFSNELTEDNKS